MPKNILTFHFQRDTTNSSKDDVLRVTSADDGWVTVKYHDKVSDVKHMSFMREQGFMSYMENLLSLMQYDNEPYMFVQISAPCHPMVLIPVKDLTKEGCMTTIGNVLSSCWRIWYPFTSITADELCLEDVEEEDQHVYHGCHCNQDEC